MFCKYRISGNFYEGKFDELTNLAQIVKLKLINISYSNKRLCIYMSFKFVQNNIIGGAQNNIIGGVLVLCAAIHLTLFGQNVSRGNLSKFNNVKLFQYTVSCVTMCSYKLVQ